MKIVSPDRGGVFDVLYGMVRRGLGGTNGDGRQFVSWIHEHDFVRAIYWLIEHPELTALVNVAAPNPLPTTEFMNSLRSAARVSFCLPAANWMLEIGAFVVRTETESILKSRRVVPGRKLQSGFTFEFPSRLEAGTELCQRWRNLNAA